MKNMKYQLIHQDSAGKKVASVGCISFLAFVKHATFAGIDHRFFPHLPFTYLSQFFGFAPSFFWSDHFQLLPQLANDPTETGYVSNRIGRAFADYFSKKLYGARFTHSYECAMRLKGCRISGKRPDFYCDTLIKQFAIEAKGYSKSSVSDSAMQIHKSQSKSGPLKVHFTAASVAYNLYRETKIKFYDPRGDDIPYDETLNSKLRSLYYQSVLDFIGRFAGQKMESDFSEYVAYDFFDASMNVRQILVHKAILDRSWNNTEWLTSIEHMDGENNEYYIDVDGIGLANCSSQKR